MKATGKKFLIAFFFRKGQNYSSGGIVDLKVGNTEIIAGMIQKIMGGDMFHIESVTTYPKAARRSSAYGRRNYTYGRCPIRIPP